MLFLALSIFNLIMAGVILLYGNKHGRQLHSQNGIGQFKQVFYNGGAVLLKIFHEEFFGSQKTIQLKLMKIYGEKDVEALIYKNRLNAAISYLMVFILFSLLLLGVSFNCLNSKILYKVERPNYGEESKTIDSKVIVHYDRKTFTDNVLLSINSKDLSQEEKKKLLVKTKKKLVKLILGNNENPDNVKAPLNLIKTDKETGTTIEWVSDHPDIVDSEGGVDFLSIRDTANVKLTAVLNLEGVKDSMDINIRVINDPNSQDLERLIDNKLTRTINLINKSESNQFVTLPTNIGSGITVKWKTNTGRDSILILILAAGLIVVIFFNRYSRFDKLIKQRRESIKKDFPDFINKLVLLLNAGLIVQSAIQRIVTDYHYYAPKNNEKILYDELYEINKRMEESNTSMIDELKDFAQRTGVKEVMRFASIVAENINKGSILTEKLETEGALLWKNRKGQAEELGKLAETKLTFPLVILLSVLIIIIIAPALMEM